MSENAASVNSLSRSDQTLVAVLIIDVLAIIALLCASASLSVIVIAFFVPMSLTVLVVTVMQTVTERQARAAESVERARPVPRPASPAAEPRPDALSMPLASEPSGSAGGGRARELIRAA